MRRQDLNFVAIDLETTGLDPATCDIIEVGWQVVSDGVLRGDVGEARFVFDAYHSCRYEGNPATDDAWNRRAQATDRPRNHLYTLNEIFGLLIDAADLCSIRPALCFHNAPFDVSFLATGALRRGLPLDWLMQESVGPFSRRIIDTQAIGMARGYEKLALKALCERFDIINTAPHTAAGDARATAELAIRMLS